MCVCVCVLVYGVFGGPLYRCTVVPYRVLHVQGKDKMFNIWFNTFFIDDGKMLAEKMTIDKANKDKKHKIYPATFSVAFDFETLHVGGDDAEAQKVVDQELAATSA